LLVCPKRAKLPSYLAFYLLLMLVCPKRAKLAFILPSISAQLLVCPKRAKLPSYLCLLIYVTLSISCLLAILPCLLRISKKGQTSISNKGCLKH
jgi:hypothetical protein